MAILTPSTNFDDYNSIIEYLSNVTFEFPDPYGAEPHVVTIFDMLDQNKYFMYS